MQLKNVYEKYKDVIPYLIFGVCTTIVNIVSYWICAHVINFNTMASTIIAWVLAVLFAYITNRRWVFHSEANSAREITKEIVSFFTCRLVTGLIDWGCMYVFVEILKLNDVLIKFVANVVVILLNYVASKVLIFRKEREHEV